MYLSPKKKKLLEFINELINQSLLCFFSRWDRDTIGEVVDLLQDNRINLATAQTVMAEIANANMDTPNEVPTSIF